MSWIESALVVALLCAADPGHAGFTSPTLVITAATAAGGTGGRSVGVDGEFDFPNAVQVGYGLHVVVYQGTQFVRFPATGGAVTGTSALLTGGLEDDELESFVLAGTAAPPSVRVVAMSPTSVRVTLPASFTAGAATAVLFAIVEDGEVVSNPVGITLP